MKARPGSPTAAVAYLRVSTEDQRLGPEAQRAEIERWAALAGVHIASWHEDHGVSGSTPLERREGLTAALAAVREHRAGFLVVAKRDRIGRDVIVSAMVDRAVKAAGATLITADGTGNGDTPADQLMRTMLDGFAEFERASIRVRTKSALAAKKARGERTGECPYGYSVAADGVHLEPNAAEQSTIADARSLYATGLSVRAVAAALAGRGVAGRTGRPLSHTQVHRLVRTVSA